VRVLRLRAAAAQSSSPSRTPIGRDPFPRKRSSACARRRSPATSWTGRFDRLPAIPSYELSGVFLFTSAREAFARSLEPGRRGKVVLAAGVRDKPETAVGTVLTDILEATVPGYVRPNVCEAIQHSRFET
jgi:hypothetical protein